VKALGGPFRRAMAAAATLTGKRFGLLVASSLVATSAIVAAAMTSSNGSGPLAALLGRSLAADRTPALISPPAPTPTPEVSSGSGGGSTQPSPQPAAPPIESAPAPQPVTPEATPANEPEEEPAPPEEPAPEAGRIKHVFVVSLASPGYEAAFGKTPQMPYLAATLRPQGLLLSGYSLLDKATLPNSIAAVSGQPPTAATKADCPEYASCVYPAETLTLPDQLGIAQFSWRGYIEGMVNPETSEPDTCVYPQPGAPAEVAGGYTSRLNPFVYFHSLLDLGECSANDVPATELEKDLKKVKTTPNYSYISPSACNAGVIGQCAVGTPEGAAAADAYLAQLVPKILASPAYKKDGLLVVTFASSSPEIPANPTTGAAAIPASGLKTGTLLVSPFVTPGSTDAVAYNPYSLLKSTEELFGLGELEKAKGKKIKTFAPALLGEGSESGGD
jgi:hypothetical protein